MNARNIAITYCNKLRTLSQSHLETRIDVMLSKWIKSLKPLCDQRVTIHIDVGNFTYDAGKIVSDTGIDDPLHVWWEVLECLASRTRDKEKRGAVIRMQQMLESLKPMPHIRASHRKGAFHFAAENRHPWIVGIYEGEDGDVQIIFDSLYRLRDLKFKKRTLKEMRECLEELYRKCEEQARDILAYNNRVIEWCWNDIKALIVAAEIAGGWCDEERV